MTLLELSSWNGKWPEENTRLADREKLDVVDRGCEVKDVLKSILNVVVRSGLSAMR